MKCGYLASILATAGALLLTPSAEASTISLSDGITTVTVGDDTLTDLYNGTSGVVAWQGSVGAWKVNVTTGLSKPIVGPARLELTSVNVSNLLGSTGTLTIKHTDTGFTLGGGGYMEMGGVTAGTLTYAAYWDPSNLPFGQAHLINTMTFTVGDFSGVTTGPGPSDALYSLTQVVQITHPASPLKKGKPTGIATSLGATIAVSEPSSDLFVAVAVVFLIVSTYWLRPRG